MDNFGERSSVNVELFISGQGAKAKLQSEKRMDHPYSKPVEEECLKNTQDKRRFQNLNRAARLWGGIFSSIGAAVGFGVGPIAAAGRTGANVGRTLSRRSIARGALTRIGMGAMFGAVTGGAFMWGIGAVIGVIIEANAK